MSGYPIEREDREFIRSLPNESPVLAMRGTFQEIRLDAKQILQVENQARQGSCAGHSLSSILEWCYAIATGGDRISLSRAMAYYETQRIDGIRGDNGSTIAGGCKLAVETGVCREELWKYPASYSPARPSNFEEIKEDAAKYKVKTRIKMTSYDGVRTFLGAGLGGIHGGWSWNSSFEKKVVETFNPTNHDGGHSEATICLSTKEDSNGRPFVWVLGSWGKGFAEAGWQEVSPTCLQQMLKHPNTVLVGLSDMSNIKPRKFDVNDLKQSLRI